MLKIRWVAQIYLADSKQLNVRYKVEQQYVIIYLIDSFYS